MSEATTPGGEGLRGVLGDHMGYDLLRLTPGARTEGRLWASETVRNDGCDVCFRPGLCPRPTVQTSTRS